MGYVEGLNDARTLHGKWRISARLGWAGEKGDFFSILLLQPTLGFGRRWGSEGIVGP